MIYLDSGATSFPKPPAVRKAMDEALVRCANPGRGGYEAAMEASNTVFRCREAAGRLFSCQPEQVVLTTNCTHGLNIAIRSLVKPGMRVAVSGFEHNAVTRPLYALGAQMQIAGRKLFDWEDTVAHFHRCLDAGAEVAVFTHVSNVFGYILPVEEMAALCRQYGVCFLVDAAQSAGSLPVSLRKWGADFIAMPGHKGLLGPQGTGILLCGHQAEPLIRGGTGSLSWEQTMPADLPDRLEAGTQNVPGIAGLGAGIRWIRRRGTEAVSREAQRQAKRCARELENRGMSVFYGPHQGATVSFLTEMDCEDAARCLAEMGIALRAGLHCAPLAHESAGTLETGTLRISFGHDASDEQTRALLRGVSKLSLRKS